MEEKLEKISKLNSMVWILEQLKREVEKYAKVSPNVDFGIHAGGAIETLDEVFKREIERVRAT